MNRLTTKSALSHLIKIIVQKSKTEHGQNAQIMQAQIGVLDRKRDEESSQQDKRDIGKIMKLKSYLTVCVDSGQIDKAINYLTQIDKSYVSHYNIIFKGLAQEGSVMKFKKLQQTMASKYLFSNTETLVLLLLAHANCSTKNRTEIVKIIERIQKKGQIDTLFHRMYLNEHERQLVRSMIKKYKPDFEDSYPDVITEYSCNLVNNLSDISPIQNYIGPPSNPKELLSLAEQQYKMEKQPSVLIKSIAPTKLSRIMLKNYRNIWQAHVVIWREAIEKALDQELKLLQESSEDSNRVTLYPYLKSIEKDTLVQLMLDEIEVIAFWVNYSLSASILHKQLGTRIMKHYLLQKELSDGSYDEKKKLFTQYLKEYYPNPKIAGEYNPRLYIQTKARDMKNYAIYRDHYDHIPTWPTPVIMAVGKLLYSILLKEIKFDQAAANNPTRKVIPENMIDAFYTAYSQVPDTFKIKEEFRTHRDLERLQRKCSSYMIRFTHDQLPCLSPPMPWITSTVGGYLSTRTPLARDKYSYSDASQFRKYDQYKLYPSLDSLNALSVCPWIVNQDILDLVIHLFRSGGDTKLSVPHDQQKMILEAPAKPGKDASEADKIMFRRESKKYEKTKAEMYSLWSDCLYRLTIANHFRSKVFWLPHNMDFRGRTYPVPPHFNHLGADLARSLLLFGKGRPLGDKGLDWLKIHVINLTGSMKRSSIKERLEFANSILHTDILDSADNPWDGKRWWQKYDNPWQVLAACKEIAKAIRSKNVREYVSHLPIHQDGSCNGLQHYAALGRDVQGALAVNLIPSDKPQDVYSHIVDLVEEARVRDAEAGNEHAIRLQGLVQRKVIKQTVMTTVYGVTRYGAHQQIARQLANRGYPQDQIWKSSHYLTAKTFESIGMIFSSSMKIQTWLNECAKTVATRFNQPVDWITPLGFPIVQPYMKKNDLSGNSVYSSSSSAPMISLKAFEIFDDYNNTKLQDSDSSSSLTDLDNSTAATGNSNDNNNNRLKLFGSINRPKHKSAFPPNYVHSLDASHMMLTSLYCQKAGITFVSVHDCFWTHAIDVDAMNVICRDQFIALHSEPLLEQLAQHFICKYAPTQLADHHQAISQQDMTLAGKLASARSKADQDMRLIFYEVPKQGDLDLNLVRNSTYFFS